MTSALALCLGTVLEGVIGIILTPSSKKQHWPGSCDGVCQWGSVGRT